MDPIILVIWIKQKSVSGSGFVSNKNHVPDPHQSDKLDPKPDPHHLQMARQNEPISALFQRLQPLPVFGS
jgi:hypothetical protein